MASLNDPDYFLIGLAHGVKFDQDNTAQFLGATSVMEMNRDHDNLHNTLCNLFCLPSFSMQEAQVVKLDDHGKELARLEEVAVLCVQRLIYAHGKRP